VLEGGDFLAILKHFGQQLMWKHVFIRRLLLGHICRLRRVISQQRDEAAQLQHIDKLLVVRLSDNIAIVFDRKNLVLVINYEVRQGDLALLITDVLVVPVYLIDYHFQLFNLD